MSKHYELTIHCDGPECGASSPTIAAETSEALLLKRVMELRGWSVVPSVGGSMDLCPECSKSAPMKSEPCGYCGENTLMVSYRDKHGRWPACCAQCAVKSGEDGDLIWQPVSE